MSLTKVQIGQALLQSLTSDAALINSYDAELLKAVKDITTRMDSLENTDTTISTVADTNTVSFPTDMRYVKGIAISTYDPMDIITFNEWRAYSNTSTATSRPLYYAVRKKTIYLYPTPDTVYELIIDQSKRHSALTATLELTDEYLDVIVAGTAKWLYLGYLKKADHDSSKLSLWSSVYENELSKLISDDPGDALVCQYHDY